MNFAWIRTTRFWLRLGAVTLLMISCSTCRMRSEAQNGDSESAPVVAGYWHNWRGNNTRYIPIRQVPSVYTRVNVAFALPRGPGTGLMSFNPTKETPQEFRRGMRALQKKGTEVLISIGGGNHPIELKTVEMREQFVRSMRDIIDRYGFDGLDINLEGRSIHLNPGDLDFRRPKTPKIVYFIQAIRMLKQHYGEEFIISVAPETQYVVAAYHRYGEKYGGYLPILHALREEIDLIHMQYYNSGSMYAYTGQKGDEAEIIVEVGSSDFVVGLSEMLILGFPVTRDRSMWFAGFPAEKIAVGLPSAPDAASKGFMNAASRQQAMQGLMGGRRAHEGRYRMRARRGHPQIGGMMCWSINWDESLTGRSGNYIFARSSQAILTSN